MLENFLFKIHPLKFKKGTDLKKNSKALRGQLACEGGKKL